MDNKNRFKDILKALRRDKGIGQIELAHKIGYGKSIISTWERGEGVPTMFALIALADYFGVTLDYLVGREI